MGRVVLKGFKVKEIKVVNNQDLPIQMEIENKYNYNMRPISDTKCVGEFQVTVENKQNPEVFSIHAVCVGVFDHEAGRNNQELHLESMAEFYPFVKSFIWTLTTNMGIAPIMLPPINFDNISIVNFKIPPKNNM